MGVQQCLIGFLFQQGHIAAADQHGAVKVPEIVPGALYRMPRAKLGILHGKGIFRESGFHLLPHVSGYNYGVFPGEKVQSGEHIVEQGLSGDFSQGFGLVMLGGMQPGALSGGKHNSFDGLHLLSPPVR